MNKKFYDEWDEFCDSKECLALPMNVFSQCDCKFDRECDHFSEIKSPEVSNQLSIGRSVIISEEEYNRLKEIEANYEDLCK